MINRRELRPGNYVRCGQVHFAIECMDSRYVYRLQENKRVRRNYEYVVQGWSKIASQYTNIDGIFLTDDVLQKCGINDPGTFHRVQDDRAGFKYYAYKFSELVTLKSTRKIQYLHELQNLFFSQMGKDIEVSPLKKTFLPMSS